ncbi:hypothetical protein PCK1_000888, partial [Pneumocystis canis]
FSWRTDLCTSDSNLKLKKIRKLDHYLQKNVLADSSRVSEDTFVSSVTENTNNKLLRYKKLIHYHDSFKTTNSKLRNIHLRLENIYQKIRMKKKSHLDERTILKTTFTKDQEYTEYKQKYQFPLRILPDVKCSLEEKVFTLKNNYFLRKKNEIENQVHFKTSNEPLNKYIIIRAEEKRNSSCYDQYVNFTHNSQTHKLSISKEHRLEYRLTTFIEPIPVDDIRLLAFILKNNLTDLVKCQKTLEDYCEKLKKADPTLTNVSSILKGICGTTNMRALGIMLGVSSLTDDDYNHYPQRCQYLEEACEALSVYIKEKCHIFRSKAMSGHLQNQTACEAGMKKLCLILMKENDELVKSCFTIPQTCKTLTNEAQNICKKLLSDISNLINNNDKLNKECLMQLELYHFYAPNCQDYQEKIKNKCKDLAKACKKMNIIYKGLEFIINPLDNVDILLASTKFDELYQKAASLGVGIGKPKEKDHVYLLTLLLDSKMNQCKNTLNDNSDFFQHVSQFTNLYNKKNGKNQVKEEACKELDNTIKTKCGEFMSELYQLGFSKGDPSLNTTPSNLLFS